jgi:fructokinase
MTDSYAQATPTGSIVDQQVDAVVFGEMLVDAFPERMVPGGAPFNVARHLAALGTHPLMLSRVGSDATAGLLLAEMEHFGMNTCGVQRDTRYPSGHVTVTETGPGRHSFSIDVPSAYDFFDCADLPFGLSLSSAQIACYGSLGLRHAQSRSAWLECLDTFAGLRYLDLNWRAGHVDPSFAQALLSNADIVKLNDEELAMVMGWEAVHGRFLESPAAAGEQCLGIARWMHDKRPETLVVTYGTRGYAAYDATGTCVASAGATPGVAVVDTVGAGDAFSSIVVLGALKRWPLHVTLARANRFAAAICAVRGAVPDTLDFYKPWRLEWNLQ